MTSLFTVEGLAGLVFLCLVGVTITGALIAAMASRLIRNIAGLGLCLLGLAGLYYFLNSPFVALMEILIYVGAVCVAIVFGIMLAEPRLEDKPDARWGVGAAGGFITGAIIFAGLATVAIKTKWQPVAPRVALGTVEDIGKMLLGEFSMVFELISLVLLVGIIGSLVIARKGR